MENFLRSIYKIPVTSVLLVLSLLGYLLVFYDLNYTVFFIRPLSAQMEIMDYFRLLTPTFLHFSVLHIVFNGLWCWEFGRRMEFYTGSVRYLAIFLALAIGANLLQYLSTGVRNFGGISGVVYGYAGFVWIAKRATASPIFNIPDGIFVVLLVFLVLGFTGLLGLLAGGKIANVAHLGGLISGLVCGLLYFHKQIPKIFRFG